MIDGVLDGITSLYRSSEEMSKGELDYFETTLEKIRSHNAALREWGIDLDKEKYELEKEVDELKIEIDKLNARIDDYKYEIKELCSTEIE
jgi:predicted  nucleic acid-binding Zn-ribbon protein